MSWAPAAMADPVATSAAPLWLSVGLLPMPALLRLSPICAQGLVVTPVLLTRLQVSPMPSCQFKTSGTKVTTKFVDSKWTLTIHGIATARGPLASLSTKATLGGVLGVCQLSEP